MVYAVYLGKTKISCDLDSYKSALNWQHYFSDSGETSTFYIILQIERNKRNALVSVDLKGDLTLIENPQ